MTSSAIVLPATLIAANPDPIVSFTGTVNGKKIRVWGIEANFTHFVTATADADLAPTSTTWTTPVAKIRRYPGDPLPFTRNSFTAVRALPVSRGRTVPGKEFHLSDANERRMFSYVGSLTNLILWLQTKVKADCMLHGPSGRPYPVIKAAVNP